MTRRIAAEADRQGAELLGGMKTNPERHKTRAPAVRVNAGCGLNRLDGWINADREKAAEPDIVCDLETAWSWGASTVDEVLFNHSLEHMVRWQTVFRELYRVLKPNGRVEIRVPHVRHDDWLNDPTHVLRVTPEFLVALSKKNCERFRELRAANSPHALYLGVDFEIESTELRLEPRYDHLANDPAIHTLIRERNNIVREIVVVLRAIKSEGSAA